MSILDGDLQILNNNAFSRREGNTPTAIIVHGTASNGATNAVNIANYFASTQSSNNPVSAHYIVDKDGSIVRCNNLSDGAWGNGMLEVGHDGAWDTLLYPYNSFVNPNNVTISIEHVKFDSNNADQITDAQQASSFKLIAALCDAFAIPRHMLDNSGGITGHFSLAPQSRAHCPGSYPFDKLMKFLQGETTSKQFDEHSPLFHTFFEKVDDQHWQCKQTGKQVALEMLDYYKTLSSDPQHQLPSIGLPVSDETYIRRSDNAPVAYQLCERGAMIYDPQHVNDNPPGSGQVYLGNINSGFILEILKK